MIIGIHDLLNPQQLEQVRGLLAEGVFEDGRVSAGWHAQLVKNNEQLTDQTPALDQATKVILQAVEQHALLNLATHIRKIRRPLFSRYTEGMSYGSHVDNAVMGADRGFRSDISMTVFLSDPDSYEGGELVMEASSGDRRYKLAAGAALLYPSNTLHRVEAVTSGERLVAVTWIQSLIRSADQRQILLDIDSVRRSIFDREGKTREFDLLSKSFDNLLRGWVEV